MSSISFDCNTKEDFDYNNEKYRPQIYRNSQLYPVLSDQVESTVTQPLANRVAQITTDGPFADSVIDGCIRIHAPSDAFRQFQVDHWQNIHTKLKHLSWVTLGLTVATIAGAFIQPLTLIGTVAFSVLFGYSRYKMSAAQNQIEGWSKSPIEAIADQRRTCYARGFSYVYSHNLKIKTEPTSTGVMHPHEVQSLYEKYFPSFCFELINSVSTPNWMNRFQSCNPLNSQVIFYALGKMPPHLQQVSADFMKLQSILSSIQSHFWTLRQEAQSKTNSAISDWNLKRSGMLLPLQVARDHYIDEARSKRNKQLKTTLSEDKIAEINKEFAQEKQKYELYYSLAAAPIDLYVNKQIDELQAQLSQTLSLLNQKESGNLQNYYDVAKEILIQADLAWKGGMAQPVHIDDELFRLPLPSAPPVEDQIPGFDVRPKGLNTTEQSNYLDFLNYVRREQEE